VKAGETRARRRQDQAGLIFSLVFTRTGSIDHEAFDREQICGSVELTLGR
jgi:hypothetical protein